MAAAFRSTPVVADDLALFVASMTPYVGRCLGDTRFRREDVVTKGVW